MKFLFDFFPILLFFIAYKMGDIYIATLVAMAASLVQVGIGRIQKGYFEKIPLLTLASILILGGATLFFQNELFIKWKPTALYWLLAISFFLSQFIGKSPLIQRMMESHLSLKKEIWHRLNLSWVLFFTLMGGLNLYVAYHFDTNTWVNFKLFGSLSLTLIFVLVQGIYLARRGNFS